MSDFGNNSDGLLKLILPCLLCAVIGSGLTFAGLALHGHARSKPKYQPGDWVQSKLGGKCGIIHDVDDYEWETQAQYGVRFPDEEYRKHSYWTGYFSEGELDWCSPPTSGTSRITMSPLQSAATSTGLAEVK